MTYIIAMLRGLASVAPFVTIDVVASPIDPRYVLAIGVIVKRSVAIRANTQVS